MNSPSPAQAKHLILDTNDMLLQDCSGDSSMLLRQSNDRKITKGMSFFALAATILLYQILLAAKLECLDVRQFYWFYLDIPFLMSVVAFSVGFINFIEIETKNKKSIYKFTANIYKQVIWIVAFSDFYLLCFQFLLTSYLDGSFEMEVWAIFVPIFMLFVLTTLSIIFIAPGFLSRDVRFLKVLSIIMIYYLSIVAFVIVLCLKLNRAVKWGYLPIFGILIGAMVVHVLLVVSDCERVGFPRLRSELMGVVSVLAMMFMVLSNVEDENKMNWFLALSPSMLGNLYFVGVSMAQLFEDSL